jgi:hypothetical protein
MSIATSQQIAKWFELYKSIDVTFTKEILHTTGLDPRGVYLKCVGEQWPCVLYSSSFMRARVVATSKGAFVECLKRGNNLVSLRLSFRLVDKVDPIAFSISAKVAGLSPYTQAGGDFQYLSLAFTQQPPDDYVEIMGRLLEANINAARRREDRILLTPDAMRHLNLVTKDCVVFVQGVPRKCILRDLSFSGAKMVIAGLSQYLEGKDCTLRVEMDEPREFLDIKGSILRCEDVEGRKDLTAIAIHFDEQTVPMSFKMHMNECLSQHRTSRVDEPPPEPPRRPASPATPAPTAAMAHANPPASAHTKKPNDAANAPPPSFDRENGAKGAAS